MLRVGDELLVGRVIHRLDSDDARLELRIVLERVMDELELRRRRPDDEDAPGGAELLRDGLEEAVRVVRVVVDVLRHGPLGVAMKMVRRRVQRLLVEALGVDVEDARFAVVDPYGDVTIRSHGCALRSFHAS